MSFFVVYVEADGPIPAECSMVCRAMISQREGRVLEDLKLSTGTQWVHWNATRESLATPGNESCVVARESGTKRRQLVLKPCDRASK